MLTKREVERTQTRIQGAVLALGFTEFTTAQIAAVLHMSEEDIRFVLHYMVAAKQIVLVKSPVVFSDLWRLAPVAGTYAPAQIQTVRVAEAI
jgi:hypothetical protein